MILLLLRLGIFLAFIGCVVMIPYFLLNLSKKERNKQEKAMKQTDMQDIPKQSFTRSASIFEQTKVTKLISSIETRQQQLVGEKKWLSLESNHDLTDTFESDLKKYKELYLNVKDKSSIEEEAINALQLLNERLDNIEKEIEGNKKSALHRQGYIIEKRREKERH